MIIGFIGLGNMGGGMAANLAKAGHDVRAFDLSAEATARAQEAGCTIAASAREAVAGAEVVVTMLPNGAIVQAVYANDVIGHAPTTALLMDCSTIDVATAREVAETATKAGYAMLDAPVSGGIAAANAGTLTVMVGGEADSRRGQRRGAGRQDLQQHAARRQHGRHLRNLQTGRKAGAGPANLLRHLVKGIGSVLVDDRLLPGARRWPADACG